MILRAALAAAVGLLCPPGLAAAVGDDAGAWTGQDRPLASQASLESGAPAAERLMHAVDAARRDRAMHAVDALHPPRGVFVVGDAMARGPGQVPAPGTDWGPALQSFLDPRAWEVRDHTRDHTRDRRSAREVVEQDGRAAVERDLRAGDVVLIQSGHRAARAGDPAREREDGEAVPRRFSRYIELARARGATPVLITPMAQRRFVDGRLQATRGASATAVRALAAQASVALIDLAQSSRAWLQALGEDGARLYELHDPASGPAGDDIHLGPAGVVQIACLVMRDARVLLPALSMHIVRDTDCGAADDAPARRAAQPHPSRVQAAATLPTRRQPGPHGGPGETVAWPYFEDAPELPFAFRRRVLSPGAGIGLHPQEKDEIYYVLAGQGRYVIDGAVHRVGPGDAMLTRPGSTHAIQQEGDVPLELLIVYPQAPAPDPR